MTIIELHDSGRSGARDLPVWDPLVRLIHWSVALTILINSFTDGEAALHHWLGYAALVLVAVRLVWGVIGDRHARFCAFPPNPAAALRHLKQMRDGDRRIHLSHNPLGALMVYNIWASIAVIGATGYMMGTRQFFGVDWVETAHEIAYGWVLFSVALHVGGVLFESWRTRVPLLRAMITGRKRLPDGAETE